MSKTVWIADSHRTTNHIYHPNPDCPRIKGDAEAVDRNEVPHRRACNDQACTGEVSQQLQATDCPVCGAAVRKQLAFHLANDCDGDSDSEVSA